MKATLVAGGARKDYAFRKKSGNPERSPRAAPNSQSGLGQVPSPLGTLLEVYSPTLGVGDERQSDLWH